MSPIALCWPRLLLQMCQVCGDSNISRCHAATTLPWRLICMYFCLLLVSQLIFTNNFSPHRTLNTIKSLMYLDVFGLLSDSGLTHMEKAFKNIGINKFVHSSVARPTVMPRRTSVWGLRTRDWWSNAVQMNAKACVSWESFRIFWWIKLVPWINAVFLLSVKTNAVNHANGDDVIRRFFHHLVFIYRDRHISGCILSKRAQNKRATSPNTMNIFPRNNSTMSLVTMSHSRFA